MRQSVCFHVGLPKTGTTTIQKFLREQEDPLRSLGFLYPGAREHPALGASHNHPTMFNAMTGKARAASAGIDPEACREVVAQAFEKFHQSDLTHLIWSFELMALGVRNWDVDYLEGVLKGVDVRIVCFVRYTDDWLQSLIKQRVWMRAGPRGERTYDRPLRPLTPSRATGAPKKGARTSNTLAQGAKINEALRTMRSMLPLANIVVRSFDATREAGKVVTGALAAMGVPVEAFPDADDEARIYNPTKSDSYSMLLYHLEIAQAGREVVRAVAKAARENGQGLKSEPLDGRRFRFLSDQNVLEARAYYDRLREDYPDLPAQPPLAAETAQTNLPKAEGVALLDWLRPDISDAIFDKACAAYPADVKADPNDRIDPEGEAA